MTDNYAKIAQNNLDQLYNNLPDDLARNLPGKKEGNRFVFNAFGETCVIAPDGISLGGKKHLSVFDILISLYALNARPEECVPEPLKSFKEFDNSMPYVGAFTTHTEQLLVPCVEKIQAGLDKIKKRLNGVAAGADVGGDFSVVVHPLPKIQISLPLGSSRDTISAIFFPFSMIYRVHSTGAFRCRDILLRHP